jgi:mono/diheme cytochrome c family protein
MKTLLSTGALLAAIILLTMRSAGTAQQAGESNSPPAADAAADVEHGRYLVHQVCLCIICHSPKDASGELMESRLLTGGTIPLDSPYPEQDWAFRAPKLRGLPAGWSEEEFIQFLQTREAPRGLNVRLPMPPFHLNERDARAVAAYLKSLG